MKQNIGWYDVYKSGELSNRLSEYEICFKFNFRVNSFEHLFLNKSDVNKVKDGISDKFGNAIQYLCTFAISILIAFIKGWQLTIVIMSVSPILFLATVAFTKVIFILLNHSFFV